MKNRRTRCSGRISQSRTPAASPDLLRAVIKTFADALMSAEADAACNAEYGQVSGELVDFRNGYRPREVGPCTPDPEVQTPCTYRAPAQKPSPSTTKSAPIATPAHHRPLPWAGSVQREGSAGS